MPTGNTQRGFSLVELMVGVVITLIASVVIFQVFALAERNKRTATGASDAQTNGALALFILEREVRMAGFGLAGGALADCNPATTYAGYSVGASEIDLGGITQAVSIINGEHNAPDSIRLAMSGSDSPANLIIGRTRLRDSMNAPSDELKVESTHGCAAGGLILMVQPCPTGGTAAGSCALMEITGVDQSALTLQHRPANSGAIWPPFKGDQSCKAYGVCMPMPESRGFTQFAIVDRQLSGRRVDSAGRDIAGAPANPLAPEIMDMQAQYGLSATASGTLDWQEPSGSWAAGALTQVQVKQIKAIRVAVVARSGEYEKHRDAEGVCDTTASAPTYSWGRFDTTLWPVEQEDPLQDWRCYRYKVFETVVPLINVIWAKV